MTQALPPRPDFRQPPLRVYREITERPLFIKSRRPLVPLAAESELAGDTATSGFPDHLRAQAVVITPEASRVLLYNRKSRATVYLGIYDEIEGWRVTRIERSGATMTRGRKQVFLTIAEASEP